MSDELETLFELQHENLFVEVVQGLQGIYLALSKHERGLCLTLDEALHLKMLIQQALDHDRKIDYKKWENFESEPE